MLEAARWLGLLPAYVDQGGVTRSASQPSLVAVAAAVAGVPGADADAVVALGRAARDAARHRVVEPVVVAWQPGPVLVPFRPDAGVRSVEVTVDPADPLRGGLGLSVEVVRPGVVDLGPLGLPLGRHRLRLVGAGNAGAPRRDVGAPRREAGAPRRDVGDRADGHVSTLVVAPRRLPGIGDVVGGGSAPWGVFAPVWSAWTATRPEVHLGSLDEVGSWVARCGGQLVGTLPLLATFADRPCDPSPYSPVSRRRWNEALVDLRDVPGFHACAEARALADAVVPSDPRAPWDPVAHWAAVRPVLAVLAERARTDDEAAAPVLEALATDPELGAYAWFRAEVERTGSSWRTRDRSAAPTLDPRAPDPRGVRADPDVWCWAWSQWVVATQLDRLASRFAQRHQSLYLDLALGAHPDGFDTWADPSLFGWGASVGAPPDLMFGGGQDWGFPPVRPEEARASGHEEWALALRTHFGVAGVLRLDHILGLQRLYWVPDGAPATEGVYVRQPLEELLAVLAVEAGRAGAAVVGEDLGTVDPEVREAMGRVGVAGMYVAQFAAPMTPTDQPQWPAPGQLAAVNTHDMPTFAGWMAAADADQRQIMGLVDSAGAAAVRDQRAVEVAGLRAGLGVAPPPAGEPSTGWQELLGALVARLGSSAAAAVVVALDDLVGATEQQNVPGTPWTRPNWVQRLPEPVDVLAEDEGIDGVLRRLDDARRHPHRGGS